MTPTALLRATKRGAAWAVASALLAARDRAAVALLRLYGPAIATALLAYVFSPFIIAVVEMVTPLRMAHGATSAWVRDVVLAAAYLSIALRLVTPAARALADATGPLRFLAFVPLWLLLLVAVVVPPTSMVVAIGIGIYTAVFAIAAIVTMIPSVRKWAVMATVFATAPSESARLAALDSAFRRS